MSQPEDSQSLYVLISVLELNSFQEVSMSQEGLSGQESVPRRSVSTLQFPDTEFSGFVQD